MAKGRQISPILPHLLKAIVSSPSTHLKISGSGLRGLNSGPNSIVIGLCQSQLFSVTTPNELAHALQHALKLIAKARNSYANMDMIVFPEFMLHGPSISTHNRTMCTLDGPEVKTIQAKEVVDCYRKTHPWIPVELWYPGNCGIPTFTGPGGMLTSHIICHDGQLPEMARESPYKGAEVMIRTAGYTSPIKNSGEITNCANAFCNLIWTASVGLAGSDDTFNGMGEAMFCNLEDEIAKVRKGTADEVFACEVRISDAREKREFWAVENNLYQFGHRGYVAVEGGATGCPYMYMQDLMKGDYK